MLISPPRSVHIGFFIREKNKGFAQEHWQSSYLDKPDRPNTDNTVLPWAIVRKKIVMCQARLERKKERRKELRREKKSTNDTTDELCSLPRCVYRAYRAYRLVFPHRNQTAWRFKFLRFLSSLA